MVETTMDNNVKVSKVVVEARVREILGDEKMSAEFLGALDNKVRGLIADARVRCHVNGRKTLQACDL